jgi:phenylacetate-CoA ligase/benzoylacetate-CoA ligase
MDQYWNPELETRPWADVLAWQHERATTLVEDLHARSEFYRSKLEGQLGSVGAGDRRPPLTELPLTTKDELREAQGDDLRGRPLGAQQAVDLERVIQFVSSSGTTGRPVFYGLTSADQAAWADGVANTFFTAGIRPDDVVAHLVSLPIVAGGFSYAIGFQRIGAAVAWVGGLPPERMLSSLVALQASAVLCTTSFAVYLTDHSERLAGRPAWQLGVHKIIGGGEPGLGEPEIREKVIAGWRTNHVRETMGLGDVLSSMWAECDEGSGMHFNAQAHVLVELIDPDTLQPVPWRDGATGEAVYTTLGREATPVLRFRSADHLVVTGTSCRCGRTSPKIRCIGRTDDMLIYKGMNVFPTALRDVIMRRFSDAVEPYLRVWKDRSEQVQFDSPIPLDVEAQPSLDAQLYSGLASRIEEAVRANLQVRVAVSVVPAGSIPRTAYKTPLVHVREPH